MTKPTKFELITAIQPIKIEDWTVALVAVAATVILVPLVEAALRRLTQNAQGAKKPLLQLVSENILPLSRILYPIGLSIFIDAAPIDPKLAARLSHFEFFLFVIFITMLVRRTALWGILWYTSRHDTRNSHGSLEHGFVPLLKNVVTLLTVTFAVITTLQHFGYNVMSLVAALGVSSLAVGLAAQSTLSNMISGFILIIDRNLRPGDRISLAGNIGQVQEIGLRSTRLDLRDGNIMIVPNSDLVTSRIINLSMTHNRFGASTKFCLPLSISFEQIQKIVNETVAEIPRARKDKPPTLLLSSLLDGQQTLTAGFGIIDPDDQAEALSQFHQGLLKRLSSDGASLLSTPAAPL